jgi:hypothetical protein
MPRSRAINDLFLISSAIASRPVLPSDVIAHFGNHLPPLFKGQVKWGDRNRRQLPGP